MAMVMGQFGFGPLPEVTALSEYMVFHCHKVFIEQDAGSIKPAGHVVLPHFPRWRQPNVRLLHR
jgi:hypothetical protein